LSDQSRLATADAVVDTILPAILAGKEDAADADGKKALLSRSAAARSAGRPAAAAALAPIACSTTARAGAQCTNQEEMEKLSGGRRGTEPQRGELWWEI